MLHMKLVRISEATHLHTNFESMIFCFKETIILIYLFLPQIVLISK